MTLRDDVIPVVDDARQLIDDLGLRLDTVQTRRRSWSGGQPGSGTATNTDVAITPKPRVKDVPERWIHNAPGRYERGDKMVTRISATYTRAQLTGGTLAAGEEFVWLIDSVEYAVIGEPEEQAFEWRVQLRRRNRKRSS